MKIVNIHAIDKFKKAHADAREPLEEWVAKTMSAEWLVPNDIRKVFASASFVKHCVIFNVGGNKFQLLAEVLYHTGTVRVLRVGTHDEYNRWKL